MKKKATTKKKFTNKIFKENSFSHTGTIGDVWASLPCVKSICENMSIKKGEEVKAIFYLVEGAEVMFHNEFVVHPTLNSEGKNVMLNEKMIEMMIPLLKAQPYIEDAKIFNGESVRVPLGNIRQMEGLNGDISFVNMPFHPLSYWYFYLWPDSFCDVSKPYIFVPDGKDLGLSDKIIIARTERYLNPRLNYNVLKNYEDKLVFSGTKLEWIIFCERFGLDIPRLVVNDFLELAQALKQCKGLLSNQTMIFQIAEGMKINRAVELCRDAPNVTVQGEGGFEFYLQGAIEWWVMKTLGIEITKKTRIAGLPHRLLKKQLAK